MSGLLSHAPHHFCDDRFAEHIGQVETVAICHNLNGFPGAVDDHTAGLAFVQMLFQSGLETRLCRILKVLAEFGQELCAAKHSASPDV